MDELVYFNASSSQPLTHCSSFRRCTPFYAVLVIVQFKYVLVNVNVNDNLYSALLQSASNALGAPSTAETDASSVGDRSWRC